MSSAALALLVSLAGSLLVGEALVRYAQRHGRVPVAQTGAVQTFHNRPTPRVGGMAIYVALWFAHAFLPRPASEIVGTVLIAGIPALFAGLLEDLTGRVGVSLRLAATFASGAAACWLSELSLTQLQVQPLDLLLSSGPLALIFTSFAIAGVANSFNIIDGLHGLASGTATLCLFALAGIATLVGDVPLALAALVVAASIMGFGFINFPWGRLFLGDGGAYFVGFAVAWIAVLLPVRNPTVSPWASLLVCAYPVIEVLYSVMRRSVRGKSASQPDRAHLHSLVAMHIVQRRHPNLDPALQSSTVSVLMWLCAAFPAFAAVTLYRHTGWLMIAAAASLLLYHCIYRLVART